PFQTEAEEIHPIRSPCGARVGTVVVDREAYHATSQESDEREGEQPDSPASMAVCVREIQRPTRLGDSHGATLSLSIGIRPDQEGFPRRMKGSSRQRNYSNAQDQRPRASGVRWIALLADYATDRRQWSPSPRPIRKGRRRRAYRPPR